MKKKVLEVDVLRGFRCLADNQVSVGVRVGKIRMIPPLWEEHREGRPLTCLYQLVHKRPVLRDSRCRSPDMVDHKDGACYPAKLTSAYVPHPRPQPEAMKIIGGYHLR